MLRSLAASVSVLVLAAACSSGSSPAAPRASVRAANGQWAVVAGAGQLPYCLVIESRAGGGVRSLPVSEDGQSAACEPGKPVGGQTWPLPGKDDRTRAFVVFSDRPLKGETVALQIKSRLDEGPDARVTSMDLRAPGQVALEALDVRADRADSAK